MEEARICETVVECVGTNRCITMFLSTSVDTGRKEGSCWGGEGDAWGGAGVAAAVAADVSPLVRMTSSGAFGGFELSVRGGGLKGSRSRGCITKF